MKRRDFMKSGLMSLASVSALRLVAFGGVQTQGAYVEGGKIALSNKYLDWEFTMAGGAVLSTSLRNKLSGRIFQLNLSRDVQLTFSAAKARIEIPWWNVKVGLDQDNSSPDQESGYRRGYHAEEYREDAGWGKTLNLLLRDVDRSPIPPIFNGNAWFRQQFELPKESSGEQLTFCLGGYTQEDWNEYWVYVNGIERQGHAPGMSGSPHYVVLGSAHPSSSCTGIRFSKRESRRKPPARETIPASSSATR